MKIERADYTLLANLLQANALRIPLADGTVQTCVTSPPYFGLRDYGTAEWVGGDPECQHIVGNQVQDNKWSGAIQSGVRPGCDASTCKKCGASRVDKQIGLEPTLQEYIENICKVMDEVWRVLRDDGTLWLNLGDSYWGGKGQSAQAWSTEHQDRETLQKAQHQITGMGETRPQDGKHETLKPKDLIGVPWRVALALQERGWYLRSDIIWHKPNPMPESVRDRPTKSHEYIFLLSKNKKYYYDADAIREKHAESTKERVEYPSFSTKYHGDDRNAGAGSTFKKLAQSGLPVKEISPLNPGGRNKRTVWTVTTKPYSGAHFATFPPDLIEPCILAGTSEKGQCPECGAPWERVTERNRKARNELDPSDPRYRPNTYSGAYENINGKGDAGYTEVTTTGWQPTCECFGYQSIVEYWDDSIGEPMIREGKKYVWRDPDNIPEPVPQIVLDPFGGSGTTAMVAQQHGRIGVCLDLSWEYLQLAKKRCGITQMNEFYNGKKVDANWQDLPMFS
jgi:DNA modification methylase